MFQPGKPRVNPEALIDLIGGIRPLLTLCAVLLVIVLGALTERAIRKLDLNKEPRRRALRLGRSAIFFLLLGLLLAIWGGKLRSVGLVLSGLAVALVIAAREILRSIIGWWMKTVSRAYQIGDEVSIGEMRGVVLEQGLLATTLLRTHVDGDDPRTVVTIANSQLLAKHIENESRGPLLAVRSVLATVPKEADWQLAMTALDDATTALWPEIAGLDDAGGRFGEEFDTKLSLEGPETGVARIDKDGVHLEVRIALPRADHRRWSSRLLADYLARLRALTEAAAAEAAAAGVGAGEGESDTLAETSADADKTEEPGK